MDDNKINRLYSIPESEKTVSQRQLEIQKTGGKFSNIICGDSKLARRVAHILKDVGTHNHYNSTRVKIRPVAICWTIIKLEKEGLNVKYEEEGYDYDDKYPENWNILRRAVYYKDDYTCQMCGAVNVELHAHHKRQISDNGSHKLENLTAICKDCHEEHHGFRIG